jgi:hypothetical protein
MYVATKLDLPGAASSRADIYLTEGAGELGIPTLERYSEHLSVLPWQLTEALAKCVFSVRELQQEVRMLTSDEPLGRNFSTVPEGRRRTSAAAARLMNDAQEALALVHSPRVWSPGWAS